MLVGEDRQMIPRVRDIRAPAAPAHDRSGDPTMNVPPRDPTEPAPGEPVPAALVAVDPTPADPLTSSFDGADGAVPVAPLAAVSPAAPARQGRRFGSPVLV